MPIHPDDDLSALGEARARLYSPRAVEERVRAALSENGAAKVPHIWGKRVAPNAHPHVRLALVFFLAAFAFALVAGGIAALILLTGSTSVSTDNITLTTQGPSGINAGDTVPLSLAITNKNVVALQDATLEIDFPPGTRNAADETQDYPRYTEDLGTIAPGATILRSVKAAIFGGAGSVLTIPISLTYEAAGSNATFVKKASYPLTITSAPLSVSVEAPTETVSGKPLTFTATVRSNATVPLDDVILLAQFPFGFSLTSSSIPATQGSSFLLGTLAPGDSQVVTFTGVATGQTGDESDFKFTIGTGNTPTDTQPALSYMTQDAEVAIAAPFLATTLAINGDTSATPVLTAGTSNAVTLSWTNTLTVPITDASIVVAVSGAILPNTITAQQGFYDSTAGTITFSPNSDPALASIAPGASGIEAFSFQTAPAGASNPAVDFSISIGGTPVGQTGAQQVNTSMSETANIASSVALSAQALHSSGPITNSGPIPPAVGTPTTYTILWRLTNAGNDTTDNSVSATLPSYVTFTNQLSPANAAITYDPSSSTVTWKPGDLTSGQGASAAFQVSLKPSQSQHGAAPVLTSAASYSGFDRYAQVPLTASSNAVDTETTGDPGYSPDNADVQ